MKITLDTETKKIQINASISFSDTLRLLEALKSMGENPMDWTIGPEEIRMGWIQGLQDNWPDEGGFISPHTHNLPVYARNLEMPYGSAPIRGGSITPVTYWGLDGMGNPLYTNGSNPFATIADINGTIGPDIKLEI